MDDQTKMVLQQNVCLKSAPGKGCHQQISQKRNEFPPGSCI
jgi:hypothetical protein